MDIITIGEGATIKSEAAIDLTSNASKSLTGKVTIEGSDGKVEVYQYPELDDNGQLKTYEVQSRLNINSNSVKEQLLLKEDNVRTHTVIFKLTDDTTKEVTGEKYLAFNTSVILSGGDNRNVGVLNADGTYSYSLKAYSYTKSTPDSNKQEIEPERKDGVIIISPGVDSANGVIEKVLKFTFAEDKEFLIPVSIGNATKSSGGDLKITFSTSDAGSWKPISTYNGTSTFESGSYVLRANYIEDQLKKCEDLKITFTYAKQSSSAKSDCVNIGNISLATGLNTDEICVKKDPYNNYTAVDAFGDGVSESELKTKILTEIKSIIEHSDKSDVQFDYTYRVPSADKVLQPTASNSYWNVNHICNRYTIPMIDFANSSLVVNPYSIKE